MRQTRLGIKQCVVSCWWCVAITGLHKLIFTTPFFPEKMGKKYERMRGRREKASDNIYKYSVYKMLYVYWYNRRRGVVAVGTSGIQHVFIVVVVVSRCFYVCRYTATTTTLLLLVF